MCVYSLLVYIYYNFLLFYSKVVEARPDLEPPPTWPHPPTGVNNKEDVTSSDMLLAQMLQLEYDKEHDRRLELEEKQFNQHNKGT